MNETKIRCIPEPALRRLPLYLSFLKSTAFEANISCTQIAKEFNLEPIQVRKDIEHTEIIGTARIGYNKNALVKHIEEFLGWDKKNEAFLVGAGNLGSALIGYKNFKEYYGMDIIAVFDHDPIKHGALVHDKTILPVDKLPDLAKRMHIQIGIITVPAKSAQEVADLMIGGNIKAIWNFTSVALKLPSDVIVEDVNLAKSLAVLTNKLKQKNDLAHNGGNRDAS